MIFLEVRPNPLRVNEWKPKNQSHTHKKCGKKGLVKWEVSKMKSTNMNQLSFFFFFKENQRLEFPKYRWKVKDSMIEVK